MFQFFKTPFSTKITHFTKFAILEPKFTQNFRSKVSNLAKIQFFKPYFFQKNQFFKPYFFQKISSLKLFKTLFIVSTRSLSPHLRPFGPHTYTKMKVEYTPRIHIGYFCGCCCCFCYFWLSNIMQFWALMFIISLVKYYKVLLGLTLREWHISGSWHVLSALIRIWLGMQTDLIQLFCTYGPLD